MTIPVAVVIAAGLLIVVLIVVTVASLAAWYGVYCIREDERRRLLRSAWQCDGCGRTMRFTHETLTACDPLS